MDNKRVLFRKFGTLYPPANMVRSCSVTNQLSSFGMRILGKEKKIASIPATDTMFRWIFF